MGVQLLTIIAATCLPRASLAKLVRTPELTITRLGEVQLPDGETIGRISVPRAPLVATSRYVRVIDRKLLHVRLASRGNSGVAAEVVVEVGRPSKLVFVGSTGVLDPDGEWSVHLDVSPYAVVLHEQRPDWTDCSGQPLKLFRRHFDFGSRRFRPVRPKRAGQGNLPRIDASPDLPAPLGQDARRWRAPLSGFRWVATTTQSGDENRAALLTAPRELGDGDTRSVWYENVGGDGRGQLLVARRDDDDADDVLLGLIVVPGASESPSRFRAANRLKSVILRLDGAPARAYRVVLARDPARAGSPYDAPYWVPLPRPVPARCVSLELEEVYRGSGDQAGDANQTGIAEVSLVTAATRETDVEGLLRDLSAGSAPRRKRALRLLAARGDAVIDELGQHLGLVGTGPQLVETTSRARHLQPQLLEPVSELLLQLSGPRATLLLAAMLPALPARAQSAALDRLAEAGKEMIAPAAHLLAGASISPKLRLGLLDLVGQVGGVEARDLLITRAGAGSEDERVATIRALSRFQAGATCPALLRAARATTDPIRRADLLAAIGRLGGAGALAPVQKELIASQVAALWPLARTFEERYRIVRVAGKLAPARQFALLGSVVAESPDPALRWAAVERLGRAPSDAQRDVLLRRALRDPSPEVRQAAARALGTDAEAARVASWELLRVLRSDRWEMVSSAAASSLQQACSDLVVSALVGALAVAPPETAAAVLQTIAHCSPETLLQRALSMARERRESPELRAQALALVDASRATLHAAELVDLLRQLRGEIRHDAELRVVLACIQAIGQARAATARVALVDIATNDPEPVIRAAAVEALRQRCGPAATRALARAKKDASALVRRVAHKGPACP